MQTFIQEVVEKIYSDHSDDLQKIAIIIPNRRASVYIQKSLGEHIGHSFFSPKITTINEWVDEHTPLQILSQTELLFIFYEVYVRFEREKSESFNDFLKWAKIILSDFDEIDRYLVNPKDIFRDLKNIKDIDNWSFDAETLSKGQQQFLDLWEKLPRYYQLFNEKLNEIGATYQGKAYQQFANLCSLKNPDRFQHYYFVGFNAFSEAEKKIIAELKFKKLATTFFDVDAHYIDNQEHEAGHFYRKLPETWQKKAPNLINGAPKQIEIVETAQQVAQTKLAGSILSQFTTEELDSTAIILADESLLIPLSRSLPHTIDKANITMGYPIKFSHIKNLVDLIFDCQQNAKKFSTDKLYYKTTLQFLDHAFIQQILGKSSDINRFTNTIVSTNQIYINPDEFIEAFPELTGLKSIFTPWKENADKSLKAIQSLIETLYQSFKNNVQDHSIELEILYHFSKGVKKFERIYSKYRHGLNLKSFKSLLYQFWQNESLSFLGNPTSGLQIMGILETRTLDFENLIVLGLNEGNLPKNNFSNSLLIRELKLFHKLPVEEDRDAIFAHHFYRLLHRSKKVFMAYNSSPDGLVSGEKSRFITQLENELDKSVDHQIKNYTYSAEDQLSNTSETTYTVTAEVEKKLDALFERGLSPSALNTFLRCPLDFFYTYILNLREESEIEEEIESSTFGTMIHQVLERIFKVNFLDKNLALSIPVLESEKKNINQYLEEEYLKKFSKTDLKYGQNKLSFEVSATFLEQFLDRQIQELKQIDFPVFIQNLEADIEATYQWEINGVKKTIKIKGQADRIDAYGSMYRIIDYKSGKCDPEKVQFPEKVISQKSFEPVFKDNKKSYGIQLLMYASMFKAMYPDKQPFTAGIISMINIKSWIQNTTVKKQDSSVISDEIISIFHEELKQTISKMYSKNFEYAHNPDSQYCEHCGN